MKNFHYTPIKLQHRCKHCLNVTGSWFYLKTIVCSFLMLLCHSCGQSVEWAMVIW